MAAFVPQIASNGPAQMLAIAAAVNKALRGECANTGTFVLAAGSSTVTITDPRCRNGRLAILIPLNAQAAALQGWQDMDETTEGSLTFKFATTPSYAADFGYAFIGDGNQ